MKVCRYNWLSAGSLGWPFPVLKYIYISQIKYTEAILSNSTRKLLRFEISKMLITVLKINLLLFIIIFGTLSFPISLSSVRLSAGLLKSCVRTFVQLWEQILGITRCEQENSFLTACLLSSAMTMPVDNITEIQNFAVKDRT